MRYGLLILAIAALIACSSTPTSAPVDVRDAGGADVSIECDRWQVDVDGACVEVSCLARADCPDGAMCSARSNEQWLCTAPECLILSTGETPPRADECPSGYWCDELLCEPVGECSTSIDCLFDGGVCDPSGMCAQVDQHCEADWHCPAEAPMCDRASGVCLR